MRVRFTHHKLHDYVTARPVEDADNQRIIEGMRENGWPYEDDVEPYFIQNFNYVIDDFESLSHTSGRHIAQLVEEGTVELDVDDWTFRHLCGYQSD